MRGRHVHMRGATGQHTGQKQQQRPHAALIAELADGR
jgi:hypothetical protein